MDDTINMFQTLQALASAFAAKTGNSQTPNAALAAARASAAAAAVSASSAATQATNATNSATSANTSKTNAAASATSAATAVTNAAASATAAAGSATASGTSAGNASTYATNAGNSNTLAQGYNNRVQLFQQVSPAANATFANGTGSGNWDCVVSFTAPANGWVFAIGSFNLYQSGSAAYNLGLYINGTDVLDGGGVASDTTILNQKHMGFLAVTKGQAVTVNFNATTTTAPQQGGTSHVVAFFIPGTQ